MRREDRRWLRATHRAPKDAGSLPGRSVSLRWLFHMLSPGGRNARLPVMIFHRVLHQPDPLFPGEPDAARFDAQLSLLGRWFNVLPLPDAIDGLREGRLPPRPLTITFDDGYADNCTVALPILQRHDLRAAFFVATDYLDGGRMWNDTVIEAVRGCSLPALDLSDLELGERPLGTPGGKSTSHRVDPRPPQVPAPSRARNEGGGGGGALRRRPARPPDAHRRPVAPTAPGGDDDRRTHGEPSDPGVPSRRPGEDRYRQGQGASGTRDRRARAFLRLSQRQTRAGLPRDARPDGSRAGLRGGFLDGRRHRGCCVRSVIRFRAFDHGDEPRPATACVWRRTWPDEPSPPHERRQRWREEGP